MQLHVADVAHAREVHHHALEAEAEARVAAGAVAAQVAVPPVVGGIHAKLLDAALEHVKDRFEYPVLWGCDLPREQERYIAEEVYGKPVVRTDYPKEIKAD